MFRAQHKDWNNYLPFCYPLLFHISVKKNIFIEKKGFSQLLFGKVSQAFSGTQSRDQESVQ